MIFGVTPSDGITILAGTVSRQPLFIEKDTLKVCKFLLSVDHKNKHRSKLEFRYWHVTFGRMAEETMQILKKGHRVLCISTIFGRKTWIQKRPCPHCDETVGIQQNQFEYLPHAIIPLPRFSDDYQWLSADERKIRKLNKVQGSVDLIDMYQKNKKEEKTQSDSDQEVIY